MNSAQEPSWAALGEIRTLKDALDAAAAVVERYVGFAWWRGHARDEWELTPGIFRYPERGDFFYRETNLAEYFRQMARSRYPTCPGAADFCDWLFLMRHYGLHTRLLDWTESVFVAIYFAACEHPTDPGGLWALNPTRLNLAQCNTALLMSPGTDDIQRLAKTAFVYDHGPIGKTLALAPNQVDVRMLVQRGYFTIHGNPTPLSGLPQAQTFLSKFTIPAEAKEGLHNELRWVGIDESSLFPDLDHLCSHLNARRFRPPE